MRFVGADSEPRVSGEEESPGKANYFIGNDPAKWRPNVPTYAKVRYEGIYPGIDLIYHSTRRQLEYDFGLRPDVNPNTIVRGFEGADRLEVNARGDLVLHTAAGAVGQRKPVIYQEHDGIRKEIPGGFVLTDKQQVSVRVAAYDTSQPLVIDPILFYSTFLGGRGDDTGLRVAVDTAGNAYVTGLTGSSNFPTTPGAFQTTFAGVEDAFVTKLDPTGSALVYSTFLGGGGFDEGTAIGVDAARNAHAAGPPGSGTVDPTPPAAHPPFTCG